METDSVGLLSVTRKADYGIGRCARRSTTRCGLRSSSRSSSASCRLPFGTAPASLLVAGIRAWHPPEQRINMFYHAWILIFGGDDLEWTSNVSSKLLRVGWLFLRPHFGLVVHCQPRLLLHRGELRYRRPTGHDRLSRRDGPITAITRRTSPRTQRTGVLASSWRASSPPQCPMTLPATASKSRSCGA